MKYFPCTPWSQTEIYELAALAIFKDLHEGMSDEEQAREATPSCKA